MAETYATTGLDFPYFYAVVSHGLLLLTKAGLMASGVSALLRWKHTLRLVIAVATVSAIDSVFRIFVFLPAFAADTSPTHISSGMLALAVGYVFMYIVLAAFIWVKREHFDQPILRLRRREGEL